MNIDKQQLHEHLVEVSVWDHDKFLPEQFLGELLLDLSGSEKCFFLLVGGLINYWLVVFLVGRLVGFVIEL